MNFKKILTRIDFWKKQENKLQKAMDQFTKTIAPGSYAPIIEVHGVVEAFIEGVINGDLLLKDWLEYYAWEVNDEETWVCSQKVGDKEIKCKNAADKVLFAKFLNEIFK